MLPAHPEAEDLGQFVEGTLDDAERGAIVQHIADCDDCRILVVDAAEFTEPAKRESRRWWMAVAAALVLVAAIGAFTFSHFRDPLAKVERDYAQVSNRPLEARLSGFPYVPHITLRSGPSDEPDLNVEIMQSEASELTNLPGSDAKTFHTRGIALLLSDNDAAKSVAMLQAAAERDPNNAKYQSDLAVALITAAGSDPAMLEKAVAVCDRALRIDPRSPDALFNRAFALQRLDRPDAAAAYERYLAVDSTSPWAAEVRRHLEGLRALP
jgi:tetratricopeptide (TPR) repeat protein